jgi:hypothetical protein
MVSCQARETMFERVPSARRSFLTAGAVHSSRIRRKKRCGRLEKPLRPLETWIYLKLKAPLLRRPLLLLRLEETDFTH